MGPPNSKLLLRQPSPSVTQTVMKQLHILDVLMVLVVKEKGAALLLLHNLMLQLLLQNTLQIPAVTFLAAGLLRLLLDTMWL